MCVFVTGGLVEQFVLTIVAVKGTCTTRINIGIIACMQFPLSTHNITIYFPNPVGGVSIPVDKLSLLAPYIGLTLLLAIAVAAVVYVKKKKKRH